MKNLIYTLGSLIFIMLIQTPVWAQCTTNDATDCECLNPEETDCDLLPDIQVSWFGLLDVSDGPTEYAQTGEGSNNGRLRISVSTPNDGAGPLTVRGVDENGWAYFICGDDTIIDTDPESNLSSFYCDDSDEVARQITWQRIYHRNSDGTMSYYDRMAGSMTYHPTHGHNHSDDWGVFTLRIMDESDPNPLNWPIVSDGAKMGFCLMDYGTCGSGENSTYYGHCRDENRYSSDYLEVFPEFNDGSNGGNIKLNDDYPNFGLGGGNYGCSPIEQGISAGWLDLYGEWLDDQWINIEPGLCNGVYWIVGEVDRNNDYLESNEDNNWTAVPVTLTQQQEPGEYDIQILVDDEITICNGEMITLNTDVFNSETTEYLWSNGETTSTIEVSESGEYSMTATTTCGEGESQVVTVTVNDIIDLPITNDVTIEAGESAVLNATGSDVISWFDSNGNMVGEGDEFVTDALYENTTYFVTNEEVWTEAPNTLFTGAPEHEGSSDYSGGVYNGGLLFDVAESFTLNSVKVYTDYEGERTVELYNQNGDLLNSLVVNIPFSPNDGYTITLNWYIEPGSQYLLTTNTEMNNELYDNNNPMLKRTTDDLPEFPYTIENVLEITEGYYYQTSINSAQDIQEGGSSESYYYYFYNWEINNDWDIGAEGCSSDMVEVNVFVNDGVAGCTDLMACNYNPEATLDDNSCWYAEEYYDCEGTCLNDIDIDEICDELDNCPSSYNPLQEDFDNDGIGDACDGLSIEEIENTFVIFPNPAKDIINIQFPNTITKIELFNSIGKSIESIYTGNESDDPKIIYNTSHLSTGLYILHFTSNELSIKQTFTIKK